MLWLVGEPSFSRLLTVELWLSFLYGSYNGAMVVFLTEIMPVDVSNFRFSLAYSLATAVFRRLYASNQHLSYSSHGETAPFLGLMVVLRSRVWTCSGVLSQTSKTPRLKLAAWQP